MFIQGWESWAEALILSPQYHTVRVAFPYPTCSHPPRWSQRAASSHHGHSWLLSPSTEHLTLKPAMETLTKLGERRPGNTAPQLGRGKNATLPATDH